MTVADYIAKFLIRKNVKHLFGYQGRAVLQIIDSVVGTKEITYVQNFHEQASAFCACAYAAVRNDIGAAIATSGPGAVNLMGGIANAYCDSLPVLFITGQDYLERVTHNRDARINGFQDLNVVRMVRPVTKYATLIGNPEAVRYELEKAYHIATSGRKGPVLLDIPIDIQSMEISEEHLDGFIPRETAEDAFCAAGRCIREIKNAKKPVLLAGGGIRAAGCTDAFKHFVKKTGIPVVTTLNGIDAIDEAYGFSGLNGHPCCNRALMEADLFLALGVRFGQRQIGKSIEGYTNAKIIRVEIDDSEIGRSFIKEDLVIRADLKVFFEHINTYAFHTDFSDWHRQLTDWKAKSQNDVCPPADTTDPVTFVQEMQQYYQDDTIVTTDVGANQLWVAQGYQQKNRQRFLTSSGLGIMGFSLPAAIGASYLAKNAVIAYTGDGGLQMNLQELNTLSVRRNNIKCVVFNNNTLGLVRSLQNKRFGSHYYGTTPTEFTCPDLRKLADCFRLKYVNIRNREDFPKLKNVFADTEPWIVEIRVDTDSEPFSRSNEPSWQGV